MAEHNDLTPTELEALREVARGDLFQKVIPAKAQARLIELGYIDQKLGGLVATSKGRLYLARRTQK